jgi:hypothetical protein
MVIVTRQIHTSQLVLGDPLRRACGGFVTKLLLFLTNYVLKYVLFFTFLMSGLFGKSKLHPPYNNLSGGLVQQVVKCSIYYDNLSDGCGLI